MNRRGLVSLEEMQVIREELRASGKTLAACSGSFDMLHEGHIGYIEAAREKGDVLLVLLNGDESVRAYKGPSRPLMSFKQRARILAALRDVDYVVRFDDLTPIGALEALCPDVYCNGTDWGEVCIERSTVERCGGRLEIVGSRANSSSDIMKSIHDAYDTPVNKAIFFDRDGVVIEDRGYVHDPNDVYLLDGAADALKMFSEAGWECYIVTNQSGIGRGMFSVADVEAVHNRIGSLLAAQGVHLAGFYYCPHHPDDGCGCRKPKTGLLERAASEHGIALGKSWMIGDKLTDIEAGRRSNMKTILIAPKTAPSSECSEHTPFAVCASLAEAVGVILENSKKE